MRGKVGEITYLMVATTILTLDWLKGCKTGGGRLWETKREEEAVVWIEWGNPQSMESRRPSLDTRSVLASVLYEFE